MAKIQVLIEIGILVVSFIIGVIFFNLVNTDFKEEKKEQIDLIISQIINFIIFIWVGKVIFHWKLFLQDPFAVLAYPSNSEAFYIANILFIGSIFIQYYKKKLSLSRFILGFVPILLAGSFVYEFIQMQFFHKNTLLYLTLLLLLLILYVFLEKTVTNQLLLLSSWAIGLLILSYVLPFIMIYQFLVSRFYVILALMLSLATYGYYRRRKGI